MTKEISVKLKEEIGTPLCYIFVKSALLICKRSKEEGTVPQHGQTYHRLFDFFSTYKTSQSLFSLPAKWSYGPVLNEMIAKNRIINTSWISLTSLYWSSSQLMPHISLSGNCHPVIGYSDIHLYLSVCKLLAIHPHLMLFSIFYAYVTFQFLYQLTLIKSGSQSHIYKKRWHCHQLLWS